MSLFLGIELGSTKIKAVLTDESFAPTAKKDFVWKSSYENGLWTYDLDRAWEGVRDVTAIAAGKGDIAAVGISGMMHGYLAFDEEWRQLVPFRTWQNTVTGQASAELTQVFGVNIPQRWSISHLYQAILNNETHVNRIAHITTLSGYVHFMLTGENAIGIGEASGMFPIDIYTKDYDRAMTEKFDRLAEGKLNKPIMEILPKILLAGDCAGELTAEGASLLKGNLSPGIPFAPAEGDAGTGMIATNSVTLRTMNVSAGTSIFAMAVLDKPLQGVFGEIDTVTTPDGKAVAMVHGNNCTGDLNCWAELLSEYAALLGSEASGKNPYEIIYNKSLEGEADCGKITVINYLSGEHITGFDTGAPLVIRRPGCRFTLANFCRALLYSSLSTLKIGMDILKKEGIAIESVMGHGGYFNIPPAGQKYLAAALNTPVSCMKSAPMGGPFGMSLLAAYTVMRGESEELSEFLRNRVFTKDDITTLEPDETDVIGFEAYIKRFKEHLDTEKAAVAAAMSNDM